MPIWHTQYIACDSVWKEQKGRRQEFGLFKYSMLRTGWVQEFWLAIKLADGPLWVDNYYYYYWFTYCWQLKVAFTKKNKLIKVNVICDEGKHYPNTASKERDYLFSGYAKFLVKLTFLTVWYAHSRVRIRE